MKFKIGLFFIVVLAAFLRLYRLGEVPPSIISDEASVGYNAYSILKTGKDEWGNFLPLSFPAFGDYKLPGYVYATVPSVAVFGLTDFAVRLPWAIFGVLMVATLYFITLELFKDRKVALLSALLLSISPWNIQLSRIVVEANMAGFLLLLGILLFLKSFKRRKLMFLSFMSFALTLYIYNAYRLFTPLFIVALIIFFRKEISEMGRTLILSIILALIITLPISKYFIQQTITGRFSKIGITQDIGLTYQINEERSYCLKSLPKIPCYLAFNKPVKYVDTFFKNYLSHFSIRYLFLTGPENLKHYSLPDFGELYVFELPFLLLGFFLVAKRRLKTLNLILPWLILFPLASSLTSTAHPIRASSGMALFEILISFGIFEFFRFIKNNYIKVTLGIILISLAALNLNEYFFLYYVKYSHDYSQAFQYGYRQAISEVNKIESNYSKIYFTKKYGEPHIFYLYYNKIDPKWYQTSPDVARAERADKWREVTKIGKVYFKDFSEKDLKPESGALFVLSPKEVRGGLTVIKTITYLDGSIAFHLAQ